MTQAFRAPIDWIVAPGLVDYDAANAAMTARVEAIVRGEARELVWLLEHPPLYTAGTSAKPTDLLQPGALPVYRSGRGGQYTYHGPGQRVVYLMLDVGRRFGDVRAYVAALEALIIDVLDELGAHGELRPGLVGVWVRKGGAAGLPQGSHDKIAAIGVRLRRWVSSHGLSINVAPNLNHYRGIVPCGVREDGVTSLAELGLSVTQNDVDNALKRAFTRRFGGIRDVAVQAPAAAEPLLPA